MTLSWYVIILKTDTPPAKPSAIHFSLHQRTPLDLRLPSGRPSGLIGAGACLVRTQPPPPLMMLLTASSNILHRLLLTTPPPMMETAVLGGGGCSEDGSDSDRPNPTTTTPSGLRSSG